MKENMITRMEIIKIFFKYTIIDIKTEVEVPRFSFVFSKEAYTFFEKLKQKEIIAQSNIDTLKTLEQYDNDKPILVVHDYLAFFDYLTEITNYLVKLNYDYLELNQLPSFLGECILRRIWLRMGLTDFNHVEEFLRKQLEFLKDDSLENYIIPSLIDTYYGCKVIADVTLNETFYEANKCMRLKLINKEERHDLGNIHYDILNDGDKKICYIYAVQANKWGSRNSKIERLVYKMNEGILETESLEYLNYINGVSNYYPENIMDVHPNQVLALYYFIKVLKQNGIYDIRVPLLQVLSYDYHTILSSNIKDMFEYTWDKETVAILENYPMVFKRRKELYEKEKKVYNSYVGKEDFISENKTEKLIRLMNRVCYHYPEMELRSGSMLEGDYLDIRINKRKIKRKIIG